MDKIFHLPSVSAIFLCSACSVNSVDLSQEIKTGMSIAEVSAVIQKEPKSKECTNIIGASKCTIVWQTGFFQKTTYTVTFVLDKAISVTTSKN